MNSIFDNTVAFAPFYDTPVAFYGTRTAARKVAVTVECCVFEGGFDTPLVDDDVETTRRVVGFAFPRLSWRDETPPQIGERIEFDGAVFAASTVERVLGDYHVTAKEGEP